MPNSAVPLTFSGMSSRGSDCPSSLKSFGSFSVTFVGTGSAAALSTSAPYFTRRPLACVNDFALVGRAGCSRARPSVCAAAVTSIARAVAPASRSSFHMPRTLLLPAVSCWPPKFGLPYFASAGAHSVLIFVPVEVELLGHEHRHRRHHALPHLEHREHDA